jgi:hypothetical protein
MGQDDFSGSGRFQPPGLHKHSLHGSPLDRSTLRQEFAQLHQAWPWSGLARFGPPTPEQHRSISIEVRLWNDAVWQRRPPESREFAEKRGTAAPLRERSLRS